MGKRGPTPNPTSLRQAGRRHSLDRSTISPETGRPSCPAWLALEGKKEWRRVVPLLEAMGLLAEVDRALLAAYCQYWADWQHYVVLLQQSGAVITMKTKGGEEAYPVQNPCVGLANNAFDRLMKLAVQFGFTPSARVSLPAPPPQRRPLLVPLRDPGAPDPRDMFRSLT